MKAMILAAGEGTRLYPLTFSLPKPLAPLVNIPVMEHIILHLKQHGVDEIVVNISHIPEYLESHFNDGSVLGIKINYSYESELLGTAGGVKNVEELFLDQDIFMVIGGDDMSDINISEIINFHKEKKAIATIGLSYAKDTSQYGVVVTDDDGFILEFQEKPKQELAKSNWVNNGIYIFDKSILKLIPHKGKFYDFGSQLFPKLLEEKLPFCGFKTQGYWRDIGNIYQYYMCNSDCLTKKINVNMPGKEISPGIWVEDEVTIHPTAEIIPPVLIGKKTVIGKNALIIGPTSIGKFCLVEDGARVEQSIMWPYSHLKPHALLKKSIVGHECIINGALIETALGSRMNGVFKDYFNNQRMIPKHLSVKQKMIIE